MLDYWRTAVRHKVVVNLHSGRAFVGILWAQRGALLVLRNTTMHDPGATPVPLDGDVVIERCEVEFIQVTG